MRKEIVSTEREELALLAPLARYTSPLVSSSLGNASLGVQKQYGSFLLCRTAALTEGRWSPLLLQPPMTARTPLTAVKKLRTGDCKYVYRMCPESHHQMKVCMSYQHTSSVHPQEADVNVPTTGILSPTMQRFSQERSWTALPLIAARRGTPIRW